MASRPTYLSAEGQELKTWVTVLQSCQHWLLTCFLGTFQISVKRRLVYGFLREAYCATQTRNPTQTLAAQAAAAHSSLFPLFILVYLEILTWTCISDLLGGGGRSKDGDFFFPEIMALSVRSGDRGGGRRVGDFSHSDPPIFLYKSHSISHGA